MRFPVAITLLLSLSMLFAVPFVVAATGTGACCGTGDDPGQACGPVTAPGICTPVSTSVCSSGKQCVATGQTYTCGNDVCEGNEWAPGPIYCFNDCCGKLGDSKDTNEGGYCCSGLNPTGPANLCCSAGQVTYAGPSGAYFCSAPDTTPPVWSGAPGIVSSDLNSVTLEWGSRVGEDITYINYYNVYRNGAWVGKTKNTRFTFYGTLKSKPSEYSIGAINSAGLEGRGTYVLTGTGSGYGSTLLGPYIKAISINEQLKIGTANEHEILYNIETTIPTVCTFTIQRYVSGSLQSVATPWTTTKVDQSYHNTYVFRQGVGSYALQPTCEPSCGKTGVAGPSGVPKCGVDEHQATPGNGNGEPDDTICPQDCGCTQGSYEPTSGKCQAVCPTTNPPVEGEYYATSCTDSSLLSDGFRNRYSDLSGAYSCAAGQTCIQCTPGRYTGSDGVPCGSVILHDSICAQGEPESTPTILTDCCPDGNVRNEECTGIQQVTCTLPTKTLTFTCGEGGVPGCWSKSKNQECPLL